MSKASASPLSEDAIELEAGRWLALARSGGMDGAQARAFEAWRADPRCAAAYGRCADALRAIEAADLGALAPLDTARGAERARPAPWRWAAGAAAAAAALAMIALVPTLRPEAPAAPHATAIAEIETLSLDDGSVVTLGAASRVELRMTESERRVRIVAGEAFFDVAADAARPFFVEAGGAELRVVGTKFDVNRGAGRVRVSVLEGAVELRRPPSGVLPRRPDPVVLRAGERAEIGDGMSLMPAAPVARAPAVAPGAWREGRFVYADARLADLVADINRYYAPGVRIADRELGEVRLAASFRADEIGTFLDTLPEAAGARVTRRADGSVTLAAAP